ncbi:Fanconi anemia group M protein [Ananas comosus]|uniref:Fanconi anemia group M protein n=1 Tax=Ananas comosus TaxID=4615 RepID=A0A199UL85_ANACO|nr:Fanconi anemia group M protein [Ananas comosus]
MMEAPSFALDDGDDVRLAPSFSMIYFFVLSILLFIFLFFPLPHPLLYPQDFDWDAAVREIDSACRVASTSTSDRQGFAAPPAASSSAPESRPKPAKINGKARQLTLERFVDSFTKRKKIGDGPFGSRIWERDAPVDQGKEGNPGAGDEPPAVRIDLEAAKTWIYPVNVPLRDYQLSIARSALFSNTLVALPTGLGKTLIAAVVMYNYFRWFPEGKIVFAAPSRPLVMQQIEACHNIVGIPQEWTIDMTGQMSPSKRSTFWKSKRVFFVTPQVLEKDIQSGKREGSKVYMVLWMLSHFDNLMHDFPETDPRHSAHSLCAREGNEVQFKRPQRSVSGEVAHSFPYTCQFRTAAESSDLSTSGIRGISIFELRWGNLPKLGR